MPTFQGLIYHPILDTLFRHRKIRQCKSCDISPAYAEIAKKRLQPYGQFEIISELMVKEV